MSDEFKEFDTVPTPTLTLEPFGAEEKKEEPQAVEEKKPEPVFEESSLTPDERKMVNDFAKQIDLTNSSMILQYGCSEKDGRFFRVCTGKCKDQGSW